MSDPRKRVHTLLTDAAVAGLSEAEAVELATLLDGHPIDPSYEHAAAAIELGLLDHDELMPVELEAVVVEQAGRYWGFTELRPREPTLGGPGGPNAILLGAEAEATPVVRQWERSDELVLESSLTNGRIDPLGRLGPGESMRGEILPAAEDLDDDDAHAELAEAERSARFDSEVDAQLDALEQRSRRKHEDEDEDEDDDFGDFDDEDDDDEDEQPLPAEVARPRKRRSKSRAHAQPEASQTSQVVPTPRDHRVAQWAAYVSAIASLLILAIAVWLYAHRDDPQDPEQIRAAVEQSPDKLEWGLVAEQDEPVAQGASGSIFWSSELQAGVMVLRGLQANDPSTIQYQLWISDGDRDGPPVDGGVFDVAAGQEEVQVSIHAKLLIGEPKAFVITVERPGGVVVSSQERVAMVATPG